MNKCMELEIFIFYRKQLFLSKIESYFYNLSSRIEILPFLVENKEKYSLSDLVKTV